MQLKYTYKYAEMWIIIFNTVDNAFKHAIAGVCLGSTIISLIREKLASSLLRVFQNDFKQ